MMGLSVTDGVREETELVCEAIEGLGVCIGGRLVGASEVKEFSETRSFNVGEFDLSRTLSEELESMSESKLWGND